MTESPKSRPGSCCRAAQKCAIALLVNATEVPDTEDQYVFAQWSAPLRLTGPISHFGVWIPLALFGVFASAKQHRELALLYALAGVYAASVVVFYVMARYRVPLVPAVGKLGSGRVPLRRFFLQTFQTDSFQVTCNATVNPSR